MLTSIPPTGGPYDRTQRMRPVRRRRKLDLDGIKAVIVFVVGVLTAIGSAVTGLGAQVVLAPSLTWMLGFRSEKAQGTAMFFACIAACAGVIGAWIGHSIPSLFLMRGFVLFVGAIVGALITAPIATHLRTLALRRLTLTIGIFIMLVVTLQTARLGPFSVPNITTWNSILALCGVGILAGGVTRLLGLPGGAIMVSALYYLSGFTPSQSISLSLLVVFFASVIPTASYMIRGAADASYRLPLVISAVLGAGIAGRNLPADLNTNLVQHRLLIIVSALVAMFLCGRELALLSAAEAPAQP